jgi:hypothetical protein
MLAVVQAMNAALSADGKRILTHGQYDQEDNKQVYYIELQALLHPLQDCAP